MTRAIGDLLSRDLSRKIVEVIQVDQDKEEDLYAEITEYVATDSIKDQYATLLRAIAEAPAEPHDSIGVWISGFFGSGNDGVVLNIAPLYELVPWKEAKKYWQELLDGKYEWSSIGKQMREKELVPC